MKHRLTTALALLLCAGCTTPPTATTLTPVPSTSTAAAAPSSSPTVSPSANPSANPSKSPTALVWREIPVAPKKVSVFDVILSDPRLLIESADEPTGPDTFAVLGNRVLLQDYWSDDFLAYSHGRRTGRLKVDLGTDDGVEDLLAHGSELYALQGDGDSGTRRRVHVYKPDTSGRKLSPVRILPGEFVAGNSQAAIHFSGPNLVGDTFDDNPVLLDGPGPLAEPTYTITGKVFAVELPGGSAVRIHTRYATGSIDLLLRNDDYAYFLVEDYDLDNEWEREGTFVYRVALSGSGTDATYTLAGSPSYDSGRQAQVVDGQVYQLRATSKAVQVLRLHPNP